MKKRSKKPEPPDVKPDTIVAFEIHDDACPHNTGKPCNCTPTRTEMTAAQLDDLFYQVGFRGIEEAPGRRKKKG